MTKVKICGITNLEDALLSVKFGADALGFNFYPKSPRYIEAEKVREIVEKLPDEVLKVGVFVNESLEKIVEIAGTAKLYALQLHGEETPEFAKELKAKTNLEIIKAFRVSPEFKPEDVLQYEVDAILLDAYNPKEHGGTGETFDWEIAKKVQEIFPKMYLAGGLSENNVKKAIKIVNPYAVDSCSLLETRRGKKDEVKVSLFLQSVRNAKAIYFAPDLNHIYQLLEFIRLHPSMFLGKYFITELRTFLYGIEFGLNVLNEERFEFDWKQFKPDSEYPHRVGFQAWISKKFKNNGNRQIWSDIILLQVDDNEEKAFDLFFALLEEFKLEKEEPE